MRPRRQTTTTQSQRSPEPRRRGRRSASLRRLFSLLRPYVPTLLLSAVLLILTSGLGLLFPLVIRQFLNTILQQHDDRLLNIIAIGLLVVFIFQALFGALQGYLLTSVGERLSVDIRTKLFRHIQQLPLSFFDQQRVGDLTSRVTNDVTVMQGTLTSNIIPILSQFVSLIGSIGLAFYINWRLTLLVLVVTPPAFVISATLGRRIRNATRGVQEGLGDAGVVLEESLSAPRIVKAFAREEYENGRFVARMGESLRMALRRARAQSVLGPLIGFVGFGAIALVLWFGGREVLAGRLTAGDLVAYMFYLILVVGPLIAITSFYSQLQTALAASERVFALLDQPIEPAVTQARTLPALPPVQGAVEFDHVSFAYARQRDTLTPDPAEASTNEQSAEDMAAPVPVPVLRDVTFAIAPGQVVALVGPSGAGKSTTLNLLLRLYEIDSGAILVDGTDIRNVAIDSLREQMAIVPQEPVLFGGTIAENIRYGRLDASEADIEAAARAANAYNFIDDLPNRFDAIVGERGVMLSAGQRQRIAIARALLRDPRILLLDEATASLDNESEALVQDALNRLMKNRTTIVVAHRLTTVERADQILVLARGTIVERGTHAELLEQNGLYARLYTRNFAEIEEEALTYNA